MSVDHLWQPFRAGDRRALSRLLTHIARGQYLDEIAAQLRFAPTRVIALTGSAGVGKSTLVGKLIGWLREHNLKVAVLACDPQSPLSGGALLGDRFRMPNRADDDGVFIRSLAALSGHGALADHLPLMTRLLAAYGFDITLIETVGAGQGDTTVHEVADTVVLLLQPETGDDLQWEKAGVLEVADLIVVHKADMPAAEHTAAQVRSVLELSAQKKIPVLLASSKTGAGIDELGQALTQVPQPRPARTVETVVIVGAGIVGLANAWTAAKRGHRVTVCERGLHAQGASIRNFGMIWPIGQPAGELHELALQSRAAWLELGREAKVWVGECGSIHLAHRADEWAVLQEFHASSADLGFECSLLNPVEIQQRTPAANSSGLLGGLFSPTELCANPRSVLRQLAAWLSECYDVHFEWGQAVSLVDDRVQLASGRTLSADRIVICGGSDFETLFPEVFARSGLHRCKLQMMKTAAQPSGWRLGPHLASGLTLRHYQNFNVCTTLPALRARVAAETPELDAFGIHVMASQNDAGEVILGDSHEYDDAIEPFDKSRIDDLMLRELRRIITLPDWTISERWHGVYAKHPNQPLYTAAPRSNVRICTGTGGAGMTMSFALAERLWRQWE